MRLKGFIGPAYQLDSVNVDCQRCVNLYPEVIESGGGKEGQVSYLRSTPGLEKLLEVGSGPIRLIHVDSIGRVFVVSGAQIFVIEEVSGIWEATLCGVDGTSGGDPFSLATSTGVVTAASMSFAGDGTDSSTIFVDGVSNYLFKDEEGVEELNTLGSFEAAQAVFDITNDITIYTQEDYVQVIAEREIQITGTTDAGTPSGTIDIIFYYADDGLDYQYRLLVYRNPDNIATLTTAELVQYMSEGSVSGKTIRYNQTIPTPPPGTSITAVNLGVFVFEGGGAQSVWSEFPGTTTESFSLVEKGGLDFIPVPGATHVVWSDGFFILNQPGTNKFWVSDLKSFNVGTLSFASSEGDPDLVKALAIANRYLYVVNESSTEVYSNIGNPDFPFARVNGGFIEVGTVAAYSVAKIDGFVAFLGRSKEGQGVVILLQGMSYLRISTHAIEQAISSYSNITNATAYCYHHQGHSFYVLNFAEATWVYDFNTKLWHERAFTGGEGLERHRGSTLAFDGRSGLHLVGDYQNAKVSKLSDDFYLDDETPITRLRSAPHISSDMNTLFCSKLQVDMETGVGLGGTGVGSDPQVVLDWSNDGGHTWQPSRSTSIGRAGAYKTRALFRRLGRFRDRVFRIQITDPVKVVLLDAHIEVGKGAS